MRKSSNKGKKVNTWLSPARARSTSHSGNTIAPWSHLIADDSATGSELSSPSGKRSSLGVSLSSTNGWRDDCLRRRRHMVFGCQGRLGRGPGHTASPSLPPGTASGVDSVRMAAARSELVPSSRAFRAMTGVGD